MRYLVVYSSQTGNTKKLAEALFEALPPEKHLAPVDDAPDPSDYDWIGVGFWLMAGKPDPKAQEFLSKVGNRELFLFATHGAHPASDHAKGALDFAKQLASRARVVGTFSCQGEVQPKVLEKARSKEPPPVWLQDAPRAQGHPDEDDIARLKEQVARLISQ